MTNDFEMKINFQTLKRVMSGVDNSKQSTIEHTLNVVEKEDIL